MRFLIMVVTGLSLALTQNSLWAHHGMVEYDTGTLIEVKGTVVGFELMDPHSLLYVDVDKNGASIAWVIEGGKAHGIVTAGLTREYLNSRPEVVILAYQSKDGLCQPRCKAVGRDFKFDH